MDALPGRIPLVRDRVVFAALGGLMVGFADAARVAVREPLLLSGGEVGLLLAAGAGGSAMLALGAGALLAPLPVRPLGRSRWLAFLCGVALPWLASAAVVIFSDPAPFTDPLWWQGSVPAFGGVVLAGALGVLGLYQAVRGSARVASAALFVAAVHGAWASGVGGQPVAPARDVTSTPLPTPGVRPHRVVVVTLDTTRADRMGAHGNTEVDTRHFDRVASEGVRFANASAVAAVTGPSHAAMFSGTAPWENGVLLNGVPLPDDVPLLAERMSDAGYATAAFVSAYVLDGKLGFARGFDVYDDEFSWLRGGSLLLGARLVAMAERHVDPDAVLERRGGDTVDLALRWMSAQQGDWFVWVHLFDAHGPYTPPPPFDTRYYSGDPRDPAHQSMGAVHDVAPYLAPSLRGITDLDYVLAQYAGEVSYADAQIGRLLAAAGDDALVAVMGDHGESFGEHDVWFNHGDDVYETSVHVPFAMRWPGHIAPGTVIERPVQGNDLAPTILARAGLPDVGGSGIDVLSNPRDQAASMCFDRDANREERAAGRIDKPKYRMATLRAERSRWIHAELSGRGEYFDLVADPAGLLDTVAAVGSTADGASLLSTLRGQTTALFSGDTSRSTAELSAEDREMLERLGYLEQ